MRRVIRIKAGPVSIIATIDTRSELLTRNEVETVRDELADRLQKSVAGLPYFGAPLNRVEVT